MPQTEFRSFYHFQIIYFREIIKLPHFIDHISDKTSFFTIAL